MLKYLNVTKKYNDKTIVNSLNLDIQPGKILGFLGPNGAGKTTTIKMSCGLVKPSAGDIEAFGNSINNNYKDYIRNVGAVLEGSRNIYWKLTPVENIKYYSSIRGISYKRIRDKVDYYLELFDLGDKRNTECGKLSRGMQQKVAICCSIIHEPKILFLDEPTLGLDVESVFSMEKVLKEVISEDRIMVVTSHDLHFISYICDSIAIIDKGNIVLNQDISFINNYNKCLYEIDLDCQQEHGNWIFEKHKAQLNQIGDILKVAVQLENDNEITNILNEIGEHKINVLGVNKKSVELKNIFMDIINNRRMGVTYE